MLSYQHIYHAGNLADVQKHALLAWMLEYLTQKDKPLSYIETHAGRGLYDLGSDEALKTGEAQAGIDLAEGWFPADHPYIQRLTECRAMFGPRAYPGSPMIAALGLRETDTIHLAELHPQEKQAFKGNVGDLGGYIQKRDGVEVEVGCTRAPGARGLVGVVGAAPVSRWMPKAFICSSLRRMAACDWSPPRPAGRAARISTATKAGEIVW